MCLETLPVVKENFLIMICRLNEAKVVLQCGNKSMQSLGTGGVTVKDPDGDGALLAGSLHFVDGELHLQDKRHRDWTTAPQLDSVNHMAGLSAAAEVITVVNVLPCLRPVGALLPPGP